MQSWWWLAINRKLDLLSNIFLIFKLYDFIQSVLCVLIDHGNIYQISVIVEIKKIRLANNLDYAMGLQFLEWLEKSGKVNAVEKKILRDILEDADGNPKQGETLELCWWGHLLCMECQW